MHMHVTRATALTLVVLGAAIAAAQNAPREPTNP